MANINIVDYEALPGQAADIRNSGREFEAHVKKAYSEIDTMRSSWYGQRYNKLVEGFNGIIESIYNMQTLVITEIPSALETIARNYQLADTGASSVTPMQEPASRIAEIPVSTEVGMRFISADVQSVKATVSTEFANATEKITEINAKFDRITWESEAQVAFKQKLTMLSSKITSEFEELKSSFNELMEATIQDMEGTESANTVQ